MKLSREKRLNRKRQERLQRKMKNGTLGKSNGGRPPGRLNNTTLLLQLKAEKRIERILETCETPLEYMLRVMADEKIGAERRDKMAAQAAKYCHPTLQAITRKDGTDILPDFSKLSDEDLRAIENAKRLIGNLLGAAAEATSGTGVGTPGARAQINGSTQG